MRLDLHAFGMARNNHRRFVYAKCLTNLMFFFLKIRTVEGSLVDTANMDFTKVPHSKLVYKFKSHGIQGKTTKGWKLA